MKLASDSAAEERLNVGPPAGYVSAPAAREILGPSETTGFSSLAFTADEFQKSW